MHDFTLDKYKELCLTLLESGYDPLSVYAYLSSKKKNDKQVIMRHDVDRKPMNALKMAELEAELGIQSTYYFRYPYTFIPEIIKKIHDIGHEVGYHYEVLAKTRGNFENAFKLFTSELQEFRKICAVQTICMHGSPLSRYDNRDLWKTNDFKSLGILGEAYLSFDKDVGYYTDTGRSWNSKSNMRDFMPGKKEESTAETTDSLIELIRTIKMGNLYVVTHPERWALDNIDWCVNFSKDIFFNFGKQVLRLVRK